MMEYTIKLATEKNAEVILKLYHSLIGKDGCTWDFDYPSKVVVDNDINNESLYIVMDNETIIGAASAGNHGELEGIDCYSKDMKNPYDLSRLAVKTEYQNRGIAKYLIGHIEKQVFRRGGDGVRLLVDKTNSHAKAVYDKMNYLCCGDCTMYDNDWYCFEKKLTRLQPLPI